MSHCELALRTTERYCEKAKYVSWRPVGSVIVAINRQRLRRKWLEIVCDLVRPSKRDQFKGIPGWKRLCEVWTQELWDEWFALNRPTKEHPLGPLLQDTACAQKMWDERIVPLGLPDDLPFAPEADLRVSETWLWGEGERKNYFIVVNEDAPDIEVKGWADHVEWDRDTDAPWETVLEEREMIAVLPGGKTETRMEPVPVPKYPDHRLLIRPRKVVKYETDIGLSADTLGKIADPGQVLHPKFDAPVAAVHARRPELHEMPKAVK